MASFFPLTSAHFTGPFTLSLLPEVRCGLTNSVSTKVIPGAGGGRADLGVAVQCLSPAPEIKRVARLSIHPPPAGPSPSCLSTLENGPTWKMAPWRGAASSFPTELFVGPLVLNTSTSGDKSCPPSFFNSPLNRIGVTPTLNFGYEEN